MNINAGLLRHLFSLRPHETATETGRSLERYRRAALTSAANVLGRGVGLLVTLISVPLTIRYLGTERYGVWMTISSIVAILGFADLGLGNGLLNAISTAHGREDRVFARECVSSAFFLLTGFAVLLAFVFAICYPLIPWDRVFNVSLEAGRQEAGPAMAVFFGCFLIGLPLGIVNRIQMGYQQGFVNAVWQAIGSLLALLCLMVAVWLRGSLPLLVLALAGAPLVATALNGVALFCRTMPWLVPVWSNISWQAVRQVGTTGFMFLILQMCVALLSSVDNLIVAQLLGQEAVAQLAVPARLFSVASTVAMIALMPLWPAYGEAIAKGDIAWVKRTVMRSTVCAAGVSLAVALPLMLLGRPIVQGWAGGEINPSQSLLIALGCWTVLSTVGSSLAMFLNAANVVLFQTVCAVAVGVTATVLKTHLATIAGSEGIVWATCGVYLLLALIPTLLALPVIYRQKTNHRPVALAR
ncbi:MAG: lipopolysaccharide biosynthesis protein [Planctomycetota bacterium]